MMAGKVGPLDRIPERMTRPYSEIHSSSLRMLIKTWEAHIDSHNFKAANPWLERVCIRQEPILGLWGNTKPWIMGRWPSLTYIVMMQRFQSYGLNL